MDIFAKLSTHSWRIDALESRRTHGCAVSMRVFAKGSPLSTTHFPGNWRNGRTTKPVTDTDVFSCVGIPPGPAPAGQFPAVFGLHEFAPPPLLQRCYCTGQTFTVCMSTVKSIANNEQTFAISFGERRRRSCTVEMGSRGKHEDTPGGVYQHGWHTQIYPRALRSSIRPHPQGAD